MTTFQAIGAVLLILSTAISSLAAGWLFDEHRNIAIVLGLYALSIWAITAVRALTSVP